MMMSTTTDVVVETFYLDMESNQCGYPLCCPGNQPHFKPLVFFPAKVTDLGVAESIKEVMAKVDKSFHDTGMPMFPCLLHHFCLPFSPICAAMYCSNKRKEKLENALKSWNEEVGMNNGLYLCMNHDYDMCMQNSNRRVVIVSMNPGMELRMNLAARQEYCNKHNTPFDPQAYTPVPPVGPPTVVSVPPPPYSHNHPFGFSDNNLMHTDSHHHHDIHDHHTGHNDF